MWWVALALADTCPEYGPAETTGQVRIAGLEESSGVAASRVRPGVFFTHDDGGPAQIRAFRTGGQALESIDIQGADNVDWEDIAAAPCPDKGECLYIGDIGDNDENRSTVVVYVVREPEEGDDKARVREQLVAQYPDGPHDAEALLVHPCTGRVHIVTKDDDGASTVFRFPALSEIGKEVVTLEKVASLTIDGPIAEARRVTGGDYDLDGDRVVLRTGAEMLEWDIDPTAPNKHWATAPRRLAAADEQQGEAVTFDLDGNLVTTSEGAPMPVAVLPCTTAPANHECVFPQSGCGCAMGGPAGFGPWALLLGLGLAQRRQRSMRDQPS